jgi:pimeloyl-ACP methyl ester carboxylesterase
VGTSAALFAAALRPERLRSLVVGGGVAKYPFEVGEVLREWIETPDLAPYRRRGGRQIVAEALGTLERYTPSDVAREDYLASYEGERFAESMAYVRAYRTELPDLAALLPGIQTPVLIIGGRRDPFVPLGNAEFLHERLPASKLAVVEAGHFTWEDAADEYAALVSGWWDGGHATAGAMGRER